MPLVSIYVASFNHQYYIEKCIKGILNQKVNFIYEVIVHDDCSSDDTVKILKKYENNYSDILKKIYQKKNQLSIDNSIHLSNLVKYCRGKYISLLDGDDYWTDKYKLQKQVDFMNDNNSYSMCFGLSKSNNYLYPKPTKSTLYFNDIIKKHYIPTSTLLFKKEFLPDNFPPKWIKNIIIGDLPLELILASKGHAYFMNNYFSYYRKHNQGISTNPKQIENGRKSYIRIYSNLRRELPFKFYFILLYFEIKTIIGGLIKR